MDMSKFSITKFDALVRSTRENAVIIFIATPLPFQKRQQVLSCCTVQYFLFREDYYSFLEPSLNRFLKFPIFDTTIDLLK